MKDQYRKSGMFDVNGREITEGDVINANGYESSPSEGHFHCVEYHEGQFGSDIYSDFEPLSSYQKIEVIGHCTDWAYLYESGEGSGNPGSVMKKPEIVPDMGQNPDTARVEIHPLKEVKEALVKLAKADNRSLKNYIETLLEKHVKEQQAKARKS